MLVGWLGGWFVILVVGMLFGILADWLVCMLTDWLVCCFSSWLVG